MTQKMELQEELMDTPSNNASARNEINITESDPDVLKSCMDDVRRLSFHGF